MAKKKSPDNPVLRRLIRKLREKDKESEGEIWSDLADRLSSSNRARAEVNISRLDRYTEEGESIVVPGKVLGSGRLNHPLLVSGFDISDRARERIEKGGGEAIGIEELLDRGTDGSELTLME